MRDGVKTLAALGLGLVLSLGCIEHHSVPSPVRDLWPHSQCTSAVGGGPPAFDFGRMLELSNAAIGRSADSTSLGSAYSYARAHCYPLWLGAGDRLMLGADYADAFFFYLHASFSNGDSTIGPPFDRMHIDVELENSLLAASRGKFATALVGLRTISAKAPDFPDAHYYQGDLLLALHKPEAAQGEWLAALRCGGTNAPKKAQMGPDDAWMSALLMYETYR